MNHNEERQHTNTFTDNNDNLNSTAVYPLETGSQEQYGDELPRGDRENKQISSQTQDDSTNTDQSLNLNTHPMVTRSKSGIYKPKPFLIDYTETKAKEALKRPHWRKAMEEDFKALKQNNTWSLTQKQENQKMYCVGCK